MKRVLRTTMMALLVMVLCVGMLAPTAMAAYTPVYTDEIPVTIFMESIPEGEELPVSDAIEVTIQTLSEGSPDAAPDSPHPNLTCLGWDDFPHYLTQGSLW